MFGPIIVVLVGGIYLNLRIYAILVAKDLVDLLGASKLIGLFVGVNHDDCFIHVLQKRLFVVELFDNPKV